MSDIYKIYYLSKNNTINKIIVFCGTNKYKDKEIDELNELIEEDPNNDIFQNIFNESEIEEINNKGIEVIFVEDFINGDTSIEIIKKKIALKEKEFNKTITTDEIYLFSTTTKIYNDEGIFNELNNYSKNDNIIKKELLKVYLSNINSVNYSLEHIKHDDITFSDIQQLNLSNLNNEENKSGNTFISLGHYSNKFLYSSNPFNYLSLFDDNEYVNYDLENSDKNIISTTNKNLLLEYNVYNNNIYVVFSDTLKDIIKKENNDELTNEIFRIYYPFLFSKNVNDLNSYKSFRKSNKNSNIITDNYLQNNENLQLFYDIFNLGIDNDNNYNKKGIQHLHFRLLTQKKLSIPNKILFKLLNTSKNIPCIKYNPSKKIENMYRLYSNKVTDQNVKIPYLKKSRIFDIINTSIPKNSILFYNYIDINTSLNIILLDDGNIDVKVNLKNLIQKEEIENILSESLNDIIKSINKILNQSGQYINNFESFDINTKILNIDYVYDLKGDYVFNIENYIGCFSSIFNVKNPSFKKGKDIELRYIKVSNYNEMDSQEAMIIDLLNINTSLKDIGKKIQETFKLTIQESDNLINKVINENLTKNDKSSNSKLNYKNSPGFLIKIKDKSRENKNYRINISKINNLNYLKYIEIYINVFLLILNNKPYIKSQSRKIYENFKNLCEKNDEIANINDDVQDDVNFGDITIRPINFNNNDDITNVTDILDNDDSIVSEIENVSAEKDFEEEVFEEELLSDSEDEDDIEEKTEAVEEKTEALEEKTEAVEEKTEALEETIKEKPKKTVKFDEVPKIKTFIKDEELSRTPSIEETSVESEPELIEEEEDKIDEELESEEEDETEPILEEEIIEPEPEEPEPVPVEKPTISYDIEEDDEDEEEDLMLGGKKIPLFCYGSNNESQLKKRLNVKNVNVEKAYLKDYLRIFGNYSSFWDGAPSSLIKVSKDEDIICKGLVVYVTNKQLEMLDSYEGIKKDTDPYNKNDNMYRRSEVEIYLPSKKNQKISGITYIQNYPTWITHPSIEYLHSTCKTINKFWNELDDNNKLYVYNDKEVLCGIYNQNTKKYKKIKKMSGGDKNVSGSITKDLNKYFKNKLEKEVPVVFKGKFGDKGWTTPCQGNGQSSNNVLRKHPLILTEKELEEIDDDVYDGKPLEYTVNDKTHYYICPKYFNLDTGKPMSERQIEEQNLDEYVNKERKQIKEHIPGKYIIKMDDYNVAGFMKTPGDGVNPKKNTDGYCAPCCYKPKDINKIQDALKEACNKSDNTKIKEIQEQTVKGKYNYILSEETKKLPKDNIGKVQEIIQNLLNINYKKLNIIGNEMPIDTKALVRVGIEKNKKDVSTFLSCMLKIFNKRNKDQKKSIKEIKNTDDFKKYIVSKLDKEIDKFVTYNNGNLVNIFYDSTEKIIIENVDEKLAIKNILKNNDKQFKKIMNAFQNFKKYILDDNFDEDYTYLYNIFTNKNKYFFDVAINIIILDIIETKDDTGKLKYHVELICPPSKSKNDNMFELLNDSVILIRHNNNYEPLCEYSYTSNNNKNTRLREKDLIKKYNFLFNVTSQMPKNLKEFLLKIFKTGNNQCLPILYNDTLSKNNLSYKKIEKILKKFKINITKQVLNYDNKVIFLYVESDDNRIEGYIPCAPSKLNIQETQSDKFETLHISDIKWLSYEDTYEFLLNLNELTNKQINSKIIHQIQDKENKIIGFVTETNQFIPINEPTDVNNDYEGEILTDKNHHYKFYNEYLNREKRIILNESEDPERIDYVRKIKLEKNFYTLFRNTVKIILNKLEFKSQKDKILEILNNEKITYKSKLNKIKEEIKEIIKNHVKFTNISDNVRNEFLTLCINSDKCSEHSIVCEEGSNKACKLLIPKINLLNEKNNENIYVSKISDELIRYTRIKNFMFSNNNYLSFSPTNYIINDDEILILESEITQDYFRDKKPIQKSVFEKNDTYDNLNPFGKKINNTIDFDNVEVEEMKE